MEIDRRDVLTGLAASVAAVSLPAVTVPEEPFSLMRTGSICELDRLLRFLMRYVHPAGYGEGTPFACFRNCPRHWGDGEQAPVCRGFLSVAGPPPQTALPPSDPDYPLRRAAGASLT